MVSVFSVVLEHVIVNLPYAYTFSNDVCKDNVALDTMKYCSVLLCV